MRMVWHAILHFPAGLWKRLKGNHTDITPQTDVDLSAFMGRWYEQARIENTFEHGLDAVYSDYYAIDNKNFHVFNHGTDSKGGQHRARGMGSAADGSAPGALKVSFVPPYTWFAAPFHILYTDRNYEEALIAGSGGHYLWLLTREAHPNRESLRNLLQEARRRGFNTHHLRRTQHPHLTQQGTKGSASPHSAHEHK